MNEDARTRLAEAVILFIASTLAIPSERINLLSRLGEDLHVDGDDAKELLLEFADRFHVHLEGLSLADHFGPEAAWLRLSFLFRRKQLIPITIQDLVESAATGVWRIHAKDSISPSLK